MFSFKPKWAQLLSSPASWDLFIFINTFPNMKFQQMLFLSWIKSDKEQLRAARLFFPVKICKKMTHLLNAHMLPQIARSTVLHMQICFAWKSIWSCSKESRTVLLLSLPPPPCGAPAPLAWKTFSPAPLAWAVSGASSPHTAPSTTVGPVCRFSWAPVREQNKEPRNCLFTWIKHAAQE